MPGTSATQCRLCALWQQRLALPRRQRRAVSVVSSRKCRDCMPSAIQAWYWPNTDSVHYGKSNHGSSLPELIKGRIPKRDIHPELLHTKSPMIRQELAASSIALSRSCTTNFITGILNGFEQARATTPISNSVLPAAQTEESVGKSNVGLCRATGTRFAPRWGPYPQLQPINGYLRPPTAGMLHTWPSPWRKDAFQPALGARTIP